MKEVPLDVVSQMNYEDRLPKQWNWPLFTLLRCSISALIIYPRLSWTLRVYLHRQSALSDVHGRGSLLLIRNPSMFAKLWQSAQTVLNEIIREERVFKTAGRQLKPNWEERFNHFDAIVRDMTYMWQNASAPPHDEFYDGSDDDNDPTFMVRDRISRHDESTPEKSFLDQPPRSVEFSEQRPRIVEPRYYATPSFNYGRARPYNGAGAAAPDDGALLTREDIPLADAAGNEWDQDQGDNPFTGREYGLIGSLSDYPTPDRYSDNMSDDDADDPGGFARRRLHRLRHTRDDGVRGQFTMCPTGTNDPMGYCGYRLQYKWGHRQRRAHKRY